MVGLLRGRIIMLIMVLQAISFPYIRVILGVQWKTSSSLQLTTACVLAIHFWGNVFGIVGYDHDSNTYENLHINSSFERYLNFGDHVISVKSPVTQFKYLFIPW